MKVIHTTKTYHRKDMIAGDSWKQEFEDGKNYLGFLEQTLLKNIREKAIIKNLMMPSQSDNIIYIILFFVLLFDLTKRSGEM